VHAPFSATYATTWDLAETLIREAAVDGGYQYEPDLL